MTVRHGDPALTEAYPFHRLHLALPCYGSARGLLWKRTKFLFRFRFSRFNIFMYIIYKIIINIFIVGNNRLLAWLN